MAFRESYSVIQPKVSTLMLLHGKCFRFSVMAGLETVTVEELESSGYEKWRFSFASYKCTS